MPFYGNVADFQISIFRNKMAHLINVRLRYLNDKLRMLKFSNKAFKLLLLFWNLINTFVRFFKLGATYFLCNILRAFQ